MTDYREYLGRAVEFLPDGSGLVTAIIELVTAARDSLITELEDRRVVIPGEIERALGARVRLAADLYAEMRDPTGLGWFHRRAMDYIPLRIRCVTTGVDWTTVVTTEESDVYCRSSIQDAVERLSTSE